MDRFSAKMNLQLASLSAELRGRTAAEGPGLEMIFVVKDDHRSFNWPKVLVVVSKATAADSDEATNFLLCGRF
jgi:hypothetical protein